MSSGYSVFRLERSYWKNRPLFLPMSIFIGLKGSKRACRCPKRLASFRTVDSLIAKLRENLADNSRGTDWYSVMGVCNPATCKYVKWYSIDFLQKQLMASWNDFSPSRTRYVDRFEYHRTSHSVRFTGNRFTSSKDQAFFKALFFAVDRAADILLLKTAKILGFPDNLGFI